MRELERKRDAGIAGKAGRVRTVQEMLTRHLDVVLPQRGRAPLTIRSYESLCREHIYPLWGGQKIDRLLPEHVEDGYAAMLGDGLSAGSSGRSTPSCPARTRSRSSAAMSPATRAGWSRRRSSARPARRR